MRTWPPGDPRIRALRGWVSIGWVALVGGMAACLAAANLASAASSAPVLGRAKLAALRGEPQLRDRDASASVAIFRELGMGRYEKQARTLLADGGAPVT